MITIILIKIKRPNGEALEASPPANGRPAGGVQGGQRPSAQHYFIIIMMIIINDNNHNYQNQATEWQSARSLSAGQRPTSRGGAWGAAPPAQHYPTITTVNYYYYYYYYHHYQALENFPPAEGRPVGGVQGGQRPPALIFYNLNLQTLTTLTTLLLILLL